MSACAKEAQILIVLFNTICNLVGYPAKCDVHVPDKLRSIFILLS